MRGIKTLITACGRPDLLKETVDSLLQGQHEMIHPTIHEDSKYPPYNSSPLTVINTMGVGQHKSIELYLRLLGPNQYYLHCEDDWKFRNTYNWIDASMRIMQLDNKVIKVLARKGSPHPCHHDCHIRISPDQAISYGYLQPWTNEGIEWKGFSWNPGLTRADYLKKFIPFPIYEQELAELIYKAGYKIVELAEPVYEHIGDGRSTH